MNLSNRHVIISCMYFKGTMSFQAEQLETDPHKRDDISELQSDWSILIYILYTQCVCKILSYVLIILSYIRVVYLILIWCDLFPHRIIHNKSTKYGGWRRPAKAKSLKMQATFTKKNHIYTYKDLITNEI